MMAALDGALAGSARAAYDRHIEACERCRGEARAMRRLHGALADLPARGPLPAGLEQATLRRLRAERAAEEEGRGRQASGLSWWWWLPVPVVAGVAAVVALRTAVPDRQASRPAPPPVAVADTLDMFLEMPILEHMEKLEHYDAIRLVGSVDSAGDPQG